MNRRKSFAMMALAALVASAAVLVYAQHEKKATAASKDAASQAPAKSAPPAAAAKTGTAAGQGTGHAPQVLYDPTKLPDPVQRMLREIILAAESGDIENMRTVLESNELRPMIAPSYVDDPIAYWKKESADGNGRDILAAMLNVLASGFVRVGKGLDEMYVWPYFAEIDLTKLTPAQEVKFYRVVPPQLAVPMKRSGKYSYYRLGISPKGVWQYFIQ
jgi:hypothetical protein